MQDQFMNHSVLAFLLKSSVSDDRITLMYVILRHLMLYFIIQMTN